MTKNNESIRQFKNLIAKYKLTRIGKSNNFKIRDKEYAYSLSTSDNVICRQFKLNNVGLISFHEQTQKYFYFRVKDLNISSKCNRISPKGIRYYTATTKIENGIQIDI